MTGIRRGRRWVGLRGIGSVFSDVFDFYVSAVVAWGGNP